MSDLTPERLNEIEKTASAMPTFWGADINGIYDRNEDGSERYLALTPGFDAAAREYFRVMDPTTTLKLIERVRELEAQMDRARREIFDELARSLMNDPKVDESAMYQKWLGMLVCSLREEV